MHAAAMGSDHRGGGICPGLWWGTVGGDELNVTSSDYSTATEVSEADGLYTVDERSYHRDRGSLSVSSAKLRCRELPRNSHGHPPPPKPHFDFGSIVHTRSLSAPGPTTWCWSHGSTETQKDSAVADSRPPETAWKAADAEARALGRYRSRRPGFTKGWAI